jgi:hypothetical protein
LGGIFVKADSVNRWLTLGANIGVFIGIILLLVELNQNATVMKAQISNERSGQGVDLFMAVAQSQELSRIDAMFQESGFPEDTSVLSDLSPAEHRQYYWYLLAQRVRIENLLYQQTLGVVVDPGPLLAAKDLLPKLKAFGVAGRSGRLERLIFEVDRMHE